MGDCQVFDRNPNHSTEEAILQTLGNMFPTKDFRTAKATLILTLPPETSPGGCPTKLDKEQLRTCLLGNSWGCSQARALRQARTETGRRAARRFIPPFAPKPPKNRAPKGQDPTAIRALPGVSGFAPSGPYGCDVLFRPTLGDPIVVTSLRPFSLQPLGPYCCEAILGSNPQPTLTPGACLKGRGEMC